MAKKKAKLTKKQLNILYECWKDGENTKERLALIEDRLPKIPSLTALSIMRHMAKTDTKWLKMATRKKNQIEKEKLEKKKERERKKIEAEKKRAEREKKRAERNQRAVQKKKMQKIGRNLSLFYLPILEKKIEPEFFFCPSVQQYVHNLSCIFRVFSDEFDVSLCPECDKCSRMNKYIAIVEEIIKNGRQEETKRHTAAKNRCKIKKARTKKTSKGRAKSDK